MGIIGSVLVLTLYFVVYSIIHSWLASASVKDWARRVFGPIADRWYRLGYNIFAIITLLPMFAMIGLLPDYTLYVVPSPWRWLMIGGQLLAMLGALISLLQTGLFHFIGLTQLIAERPRESGSLNLGGFYAYVRHPLYTFGIIVLWLMPVMTTNTLTTFILFTLYFYFGSMYEERRLISQFGPAYQTYRQHVPRLIPMPGRRYVPSKEQIAG